MKPENAVRVAELAARTSYGRLVAILAARTRDIAAAEDALADALLAALHQWPAGGVPASPDAWLLTTARRRLLDGHRRDRVRAREADALAHALTELQELTVSDGGTSLLDDRLRLLFVCAHPAIDESARAPLMLQTVLGLDAAMIGSALRVAPKTMGQRLWRAKTKIREAGIAFEIPDAQELPERLDAVLEAVYAAFGTGWEDVTGDDTRLRGLREEALYLARTLVCLLPEEPEPKGLLALMSFADARRLARRSGAGAYVPLPLQDPVAWDQGQILEAERLLEAAFGARRIGPYQLEAAIQSAHVSGVITGRPDLDALVVLYEGLVTISPTLGAQVGRAAALLEARGHDAALAALDAMPEELVTDYQPYWAVRADALARAGRVRDGEHAYARAIGLTEDPSVRAFLAGRARALAQARY